MAPEAVCPTGPTVEGIDVSVYQGAIDWSRVAAAGVEFAYIRVGDGLRPVDARFTDNWTGARAAGVARGAYQFFRQDADAIAQADLFVDTIGVLDGDDLSPAIDVETADGQDAGTIIANVRAWMARV